MQLYIQDRSESTVATIGDFYEDMHKTLTSTGTGSYEFTVSKSEPGQEFLNVGNYVVLLDEQNKGHQFTITKVDQLHDEKTVYAEDASLQLLSKEAKPWAKSQTAQPASYYFNKALEGSGWVVGVNQITSLTRTLEWTGWDTVLTRLLSIATEFDNAELDFHVELDRTNVVRKVVDIYKQVGAYRDDIQLVYGDTVSDIQKTESTENFATAIEGIGSLVEGTKEGEPEKHYDFSAIGYDDGDFYSPKGDPKLYSRKAHEKWDGKYGYSERHFEYEAKDPQELLNRSKTELKKRCEPEVNYEISIADGRLIDISKGDTVKIFDHTYNPELLLQARAVEVDKSYTNPSQNKAIFGNFLTLISNADPRILAIQKMLNTVKQSQASTRADLGAVRKTATDAKNTATEAQSTAKQAVTKTSELDIALNQAKKDVEAVRTAVGAQDEEIANAVADANGAVAKADKAIEDAGFAKDTASQATKDATEAKAQASEAQTTANKSISQAGDALAKAGSAIDNASVALEKFNNLSVGGRNLYLNSKSLKNIYDTNRGAKATVEPFDSTTNMWHIVGEQGIGTPVGIYLSNYANGKIPNNSDWSYSADVKGTGKIRRFGIEVGDKNPVVGTVGSEWSRISVSGHVGSTVKTIVMYFDATNSPLDVYIKLPKLETGNIPTSWSPAPEDVQVQLTNLNGELKSKVSQTDYDTLAGQVTSVETTASQNKNEIATLATKKTVDTLAKTVTDTSTLVTQNAEAIKLKADGSKVDTLSGNVTKLSGQLKLTNDALDAKITSSEVNNRLSGYATQNWTTSEIKAQADSINLSVESVRQKVDGLQVGGRNYFLNSSSFKIIPIGKDKYDWADLKISPAFFENKNRLKVNNIKISFTIYALKALPADFNGDMYFRSSPWYLKPFSYAKGTTDKKRIELTYSITDPDYSASEMFIRFMAKDSADYQFMIENAKLEIGTKATDWTPAPEDMATVGWAKAQLNITDDKITAGIQKVNTDLNGVRTTLQNQMTATENSLKNTISSVQNNLTAVDSNNLLIARIADGLILHNDPTFKSGLNGVRMYDNTNSGNVTITRENPADGTQPTDTKYRLKIQTVGPASPDWGGFSLQDKTRANQELVYRVTALIPIGYRIEFATNNVGAGSARKWLTDNAGTGKWEDYYYYVHAGATGVFSSTGFFNIAGTQAPTPSSPLTWYVAFATTYDISNSQSQSNAVQFSSFEQKLNGFQTTVNSKADSSQVTQLSNQLTSKINEVNSSLSSQITQTKNDINLRVQKGDVINQINISPESVLITGKKVHITGETNIDNAVIKSAMIDSISADKISAGTITGLTVNGSTINGATINAGKIYGDSSLDLRGSTYAVVLSSKYGMSITGAGDTSTRLTDSLVKTESIALGGATIRYKPGGYAGAGIYAYYGSKDHYLG